MTREIEAIYEHGVRRPLEPLMLAESQRVRVTVNDSSPDQRRLEPIRAEVAAMGYLPKLEEGQRALSKIPGNLTDDFILEREERGGAF